MTTKRVAQGFISHILEENTEYYVDTLNNLELEDVVGTFWFDVVNIYRKLPDESRGSIEQFIRQIMIDTLSNVLGVIDGGVDFPVELQLLDEASGEKLEDLQDQFLELIEESS